ncbi:MAG: sulfatase [Candidatus Promineifilaceae bacterium]|jgi:arylsulfatase A-like enzyme
MGDVKISRRQFLAGAGAAGASAVLGSNLLAQAAGGNQLCFLPRILRQADASKLNTITVMCDTLRYDHIGYHGNSWIKTPSIDAFASQSQVFDKAYSGGFPTVLNRAELFTGRYMYTILGWEDLPEDAIVTAQVMSDAGYTTGLVFDNWHLKDEGFFLDRGFQSWEWVRGQENDRYRANPPHPSLPADPAKFRHGSTVIEQYLRNMADRNSEADYLAAKTIQSAISWLHRNKDYGSFSLHIDIFDPHEPWDPPQSYVDLYNPGYSGEQIIYPAYAPPDYMTSEELNHMRALYAAEVSMVDHWFGMLLSELDTLGLSEKTVVILMSDHGFMLGEHNAVGKSWSTDSYYEPYSLYQELVHIPMMVRVPGVAPKRLETLAQPADIMPTILDFTDVPAPNGMHGFSLVPYINGQSGSPRPAAISSRSLKNAPNPKQRITITDGNWTLCDGAGRTTSELYYLLDDPKQQSNLIGSQCDIARNLHTEMIDFLQSVNTPAETVDYWRNPPC